MNDQHAVQAIALLNRIATALESLARFALMLQTNTAVVPTKETAHRTFRRKNEDLSLALSSVSQSSSCEIEQIRAHPADFEQ